MDNCWVGREGVEYAEWAVSAKWLTVYVMSSGVQVFISGRRHARVHSRVKRRVVNIRGASTHQVQHQNKLWAAHTSRSDHCGVQYMRGRDACWEKEARLWILVFPHLWITWKRFFLWTLLTHANKELQENSPEWRRIYTCFNDFPPTTICLPWCLYFGVGRLCLFGDAAALEKREGWQLGSPLPSHSAPRW